MSHPISVIIPHMKSREKFLSESCLPSVYRNDPGEVIVIMDEHLNAQEKRNDGFAKATRPFVFFCDDDVVLKPGAFEKMINALVSWKSYGFAYCDYERIVHPGVRFPYQPGRIIPGGNVFERLRYESPICTMSLIRHDAFPGFDVKLRRHQDRDLYLSILGNGWHPVYVPGVLVELHQIDECSITQNEPYEKWERYIEIKHKLPFRNKAYTE
jgi:glycosyltransferase involved in cell wall biosynthesis